MDHVSKKARKKNELIVLEGKRFIQDAIDARVELETVIFSRLSDLNELQNLGKKVKAYQVPYRSIQMWSTLTTSPGILGKPYLFLNRLRYFGKEC